MRARAEVDLLLRAGGGLVVRRDHPQLGASFDSLIREGRLATVLPGIYATPEIARTWQTRAQALALRHRDAVLLGGAAARSPSGQMRLWSISRPRFVVRSSHSLVSALVAVTSLRS
jgi:hypothetical protein